MSVKDDRVKDSRVKDDRSPLPERPSGSGIEATEQVRTRVGPRHGAEKQHAVESRHSTEKQRSVEHGFIRTEQSADEVRRRRRERDRQTERKVILRVVLSLILFGILALGAIQGLVGDEAKTDVVSEDSIAVADIAEANTLNDAAPNANIHTQKAATDADQHAKAGVRATEFSPAPDLPALHALQSEGLTVVAEGLAAVSWLGAEGLSVDAARETCRLSYGVWEFSPNQRFRFLTTCDGLLGQILLGAYTVKGTQILLSPLVANGARLTSRFEVEKPSMMWTEVQVERGHNMQVQQAITNMRPGLSGEAFRATYAAKNTLPWQDTTRTPESNAEAREQKRRVSPQPHVPHPTKLPSEVDPLLKLLNEGH